MSNKLMHALDEISPKKANSLYLIIYNPMKFRKLTLLRELGVGTDVYKDWNAFQRDSRTKPETSLLHTVSESPDESRGDSNLKYDIYLRVLLDD